MAAELDDKELLHQFENATLPPGMFHHEQHVRVAWLFVRRDGMPAALSTFPEALRKFAAANGAPTLYHATVTWAYLLVIHERMHRTGASSWDAFARLNADLLAWKPSVLDRYYTPETLWSALARDAFVMPDRQAPAG